MKKILMTIIASMLLLSSTAYAVEMTNSHMPTNMTTMSKVEAIKMLKDAGVEPSKISILDKNEMMKTEGEGWFSSFIDYVNHTQNSITNHLVTIDVVREVPSTHQLLSNLNNHIA